MIIIQVGEGGRGTPRPPWVLFENPLSSPKICLYFMVKKSGLIVINKTAQENDFSRIILQLY